MNWYMKWSIQWFADMKSSAAMILAVMSAIFAIAQRSLKSQDFNGVWTRDLAMPVRRSNQLSYEATDVGSWSFVGSNVPVMNESTNEKLYEMDRILNCWSPEFLRLLYASAKIAFITARIIASLNLLLLVINGLTNLNLCTVLHLALLWYGISNHNSFEVTFFNTS